MKVAVVCGSGLAAIADRLGGQPRRWEMPGGVRQSPAGHEMKVVEGSLGGAEALCFAGRLHLYQGYSASEVAAPVLEAHRWGAEALFLTNASGSLNPDFIPGDLVAITDHLNLMGSSPFTGDPHFVDLTEAYDRELIRLAQVAASEAGVGLLEGIYAAMPGPEFETPAEARMLRGLGADLVGMSTVPEVIMARHLQMRVLAIGVATNRAGESTRPGEVLKVAAEAAPRLGTLLEDVARRLA